jgi:ankyrin repeat protein
MSDASDVDLELGSPNRDTAVFVDTDSFDGESDTEADTAVAVSNPLTTEDDLFKPRTIQEKLKEALEDVRRCHEGHVRQLLAQGAHVNHQYEENLLRTPLHILCSAFCLLDRRNGMRRRFSAIAKALLDAGADVNILDYNTDTVLQIAAKYGVPAETMKEIIRRSTDVNQLNDDGETALRNLFQCSRGVTLEQLEAFIDAGANLEMEDGFNRNSQSLMQLLATKANSVSLMSLIDKTKPDLVDRYIQSMLEPAVRHGTSDTVKELLDRGASADVKVRGEPLTHLAAASSQDASKKFDLLIAGGCYIYAVDYKGETVLHRAAMADNVDVMKKALNKKVDHRLSSYNKALPIHHCAVRDGSKCLKLLVNVGSDLHAKTIDGESPLYQAVKSRAKDNITVLIQAGCSVRDKKLKYLGFEKITALAEPEVIIASPAPVTYALELTEVLKKIAARNESHRQRLLEMTEDMEQLAVDIIEGSGCDIDGILTDGLIFYALENNLKTVPLQIIMMYYIV